MNTYAMGLRLLYIFYAFSAGIDYRRQILMSEVGTPRWKGKALSATKRLKSGLIRLY